MLARTYQKLMICKNSLVSAGNPIVAGLALALVSGTAALAQQTQPVLPPPPPLVSTVPVNGDVNPYGVAFVPPHVSAGLTLRPYDILVSNFNDNLNLQGTGSTIMRVGSDGQPSLCYQSPAYGMSAALGSCSEALCSRATYKRTMALRPQSSRDRYRF
jgi:hypothetical protein